MIDYEVKFLTNEETINIKSSDFKSFRYEKLENIYNITVYLKLCINLHYNYRYDSKKKHEENIYDSSKRNYLERRGGYHRAPKPRQLKQLELKLSDRRRACKWFSEKCVTLVFSSGVITYLTVNPNTLDITHFMFDKYCVGKLIGQSVTEGMLFL